MIQKCHGVYLPKRKKKNRPGSITIRFVLTGTIPSKKNRQLATTNWLYIIKAIKDLLVKNMGVAATMAAIIALFKEKKAKPYIRQSPDFREWNEKARLIILEQAGKAHKSFAKQKLSFPITEASVSIYHYWKDNMVRDNSNKAETIHDLLVDAHVLTDDTWQHLSPNKADADLYRDEITDHITVIDVTAYKW